MSETRVKLVLVVAAVLLWFQHARAQPADPVSRVVEDCRRQTTVTVHYDPSYVRLSYPGGDVPEDRGVCTDVVVRAFRAAGVDLQKLVYEDMKRAFRKYPKLWGLSGPDANIDHRRVPNLMTFFTRQGKSLPVTRDSAAYRPGDVVAWRLPGGRLHVGVVTGQFAPDGRTPLLTHNIGAGARTEDVLFAYEVIGHYRYW